MVCVFVFVLCVAVFGFDCVWMCLSDVLCSLFGCVPMCECERVGVWLCVSISDCV